MNWLPSGLLSCSMTVLLTARMLALDSIRLELGAFQNVSWMKQMERCGSIPKS